MVGFYSAAALLAMQSAVIPQQFRLSVCPSVCLSHTGTLSRRINIGLRGLVIKHVGFAYQLSTMSARSQVVIEVRPRILRHVSL